MTNLAPKRAGRSPPSGLEGWVRTGLEDDTSQQGSCSLDWPWGRKMDFSVTEGRAELLNQPDVFSCVSPSPRLSKSSGWMDVSADFLRLFSQTYTLRGWLLSPHLSSPQEEGFVQRLSQAERQSLLILDQSLGPQVKQLSPPFHLTDNVFSLRDWTGDFHQTESPCHDLYRCQNTRKWDPSCFPGGSGKESSCQCKRWRFNPWVGKIPWRRAWLLTPVFLPGKFHGQRSLVGYSPWDHRELDMAECTHTHSETPASRGEHEDTHSGILFLLPMKGHKQRSPLVPLHDDLSSPPSSVLGQIAFRLGGAAALPAGGFCVLIVTSSGGFLGASLGNTDGFFSEVPEPLRTSHCPCLKRLPALRFKDCALWL